MDVHRYHDLLDFPGSFVLIAPRPNVNRAIVFVHGFAGDAYGTWANFQMMVAKIRFDLATDFFFFQYHSVTEYIQSSSNRLLTFMDELIFSLNMKHFQLKLIDGPGYASALQEMRTYKQLTLIGHSEGGVVIRNAILQRAGNATSPILQSRLILFAPALEGYSPAGLLGTMANFPGVGPVVNAVLMASPAYKDLRNTKYLGKIRADTEEQASKRGEPAFIAKIMWGRQDGVVEPRKYDLDFEDFEDRGHTDICKPHSGYLKPIYFIDEQGRRDG